MQPPKLKGEVKNLLLFGYEHYSREEERIMLDAILLKGAVPDLEQYTPAQFFLQNQPLRSAKNMLICTVAVVCRFAADHGADDRRCFALSDTYINFIEEQNNLTDIYELGIPMMTEFRKLILEGQENAYSRPVQRAVQLIDAYLYEPCSVKRIAAELSLHPTYLSRIFKQEVGESMTAFIRERKINEAKILLQNTDKSIAEISELLGYSSPSYFSKVFHQLTGDSPRAYSKR